MKSKNESEDPYFTKKNFRNVMKRHEFLVLALQVPKIFLQLTGGAI
jgi:hypothetical protein